VNVALAKQPSNQFVSDVAVDPISGHAFVSGYRAVSTGGEGFIIDFSDKTEVDRRTFPSATGKFYLMALEIDGKGEHEFVGFFEDTVTIGPKTWTEATPDFGGVVARVYPASDGGIAIMSSAVLGLGTQSFWGNARLADGTVAAGTVENSTIHHGQPIVADAAGDGLVSTEYQSGNEAHVLFAGAGKQAFLGVTVTGNNAVAAVGESSPFGDPLKVVGSGTGQLAAIAYYDNSLTFQWARALGSTGNDAFFGAASDPLTGSVVAVGKVAGVVDLFTGPALPYAAGDDIVVARFDPTGKLEWARTFGGDGNDRAYSAAITKTGDIFVAGSLMSLAVDFGTGNLTKNAGEDGFLIRLDPTGKTLWATLVGGDGTDGFTKVTLADGKLYLAGRFQGGFELLGHKIQGSSADPNFDIAVLTFEP
jgi:hypothetical protein